MFIGRNDELLELKSYLLSEKASAPKLVVCHGRRRVGKSELIREFAKKSYKHFIEIQGEPPANGINNQTQINHFMKEFCRQLEIPAVQVSSWSDAFRFASSQIRNKKLLLFLDEISWMGNYDPSFSGSLKIVWDTEFQQNTQLVVVLCGSVSTWISENILNAAGFMGRINLDIPLKQLKLSECDAFFPERTSSYEKLLFLMHTGGVPRYLKEFKKSVPVESLVADLSFSNKGLFFNEFDRIFSDIFNKRAKTYQQIVLSLASGAQTLSDVFQDMGVEPTGKFVDYLKDLEMAGFITSYKHWDIKAVTTSNKKSSKFTKYKIADNYLRFYLKQIYPRKKVISEEIGKISSIFEIKAYDSFLGYQFEILVLNNIAAVMNALKIDTGELLNWGPYYQQKNSKQEGCQIDLLIQTKSLLYIVEIKSGKKIASGLITQTKEKMRKLKIPKRLGLKTALIHAAEDIPPDTENFFDRVISWENLL